MIISRINNIVIHTNSNQYNANSNTLGISRHVTNQHASLLIGQLNQATSYNTFYLYYA